MTIARHVLGCGAVLAISGACVGGPADLLLTGVGHPGGPYTKDVMVPEAVKTTLEGRIENRGGSPASARELTFGELACLPIEDDFEATIDGPIDPGEVVTFPLRVQPDGCYVQTIVDWFLDADDASSRGTFNLILEM